MMKPSLANKIFTFKTNKLEHFSCLSKNLFVFWDVSWSVTVINQCTKCCGGCKYIFCQGEKLYVATDQNSVQTLTFPEADLDGVVARFTAPVTHIDASTDGTLLVSASW